MTPRRRQWAAGVSLLFVMTLLVWLVRGCEAPAPPNLGARRGELAPVLASPNAVSSQAGDPQHRVEPIPCSEPIKPARERLLRVLSGMPRTKLITQTDTYLHLECRSRVFRFVDDLEFLFDEKARVIHVRSASRVGRSDLGVNRKRVETLRALMAAPASPDAK